MRKQTLMKIGLGLAMFVMIVLMFIPNVYADYYLLGTTEPATYGGNFDETNLTLTGTPTFYGVDTPEPYDKFAVDAYSNFSEEAPGFKIAVIGMWNTWNDGEEYWRQKESWILGMQIPSTQSPSNISPIDAPGNYNVEFLNGIYGSGAWTGFIKITPEGNGLWNGFGMDFLEVGFLAGSIDYPGLWGAAIGNVDSKVSTGGYMLFGAAEAQNGPPAVPEPATVISFLLGGAGLAAKRLIKRKI